MEKYLLGIDVGTSTVKACCFTADFHLAAYGKGEYKTYFEGPSYAEQEPEDWWRAAADAIKKIAGQIEGKGEIAGIAVSSQSPSLIPLDEKGNVLRRAMIWMDRRAEAESDYAANRLIGYERYRRILKSEPDAYYVLPKMLWYREHEPELYERTKIYLQVNGYINYKLTGKYSIDLIHAVAVQGMDYGKQQWSKEIEEAVDIPLREVLPAISKPFDIIGQVTAQAAKITGLKEGTPVAAGATDTISAYYGYGMVSDEGAAEMIGTSSILLFNSSKPLQDYGRLLVKPSPFQREKEILVAAINASGASVEWFRKLFSENGKEKLSYDTLDRDAASVPPGAGKLIYFPYLSGERSPLFNSYAKGMFIGMTSSTGREHLARAVFEGTSYAVRHNFEEAAKRGVKPQYVVCAGGGAKSREWLKIKASVLNLPLKVMGDEDVDRAALGDAIFAGIGIGLVNTPEEAAKQAVRYKEIIEPNPKWVKIYDRLYPFYRSMYQHLENDLQRLEKI